MSRGQSDLTFMACVDGHGFMKQVSWSSGQHKFWRILKSYPLKNKNLILLVSGGEDSMVLLNLFCFFQKFIPFEIQVLHFHHGGDVPFRDSAKTLVEKFCYDRGLNFLYMKSQVLLKSEDEMRRFRRNGAEDLYKKTSTALLVTGHHGDDLMETRILRLLRGVGPQGIESIKIWNPPWLRPFLHFSKDEIRKLAQELKVSSIEDPSNKREDYLRNWVRESWLPALENRYPGSVKALNRSLSLLTKIKRRDVKIKWKKKNNELLLPEGLWLLFLEEEKQRHIASVFLYFRIFSYNLGQVREIILQLEKLPKSGEMVFSGIIWSRKKTWLCARKSDFG